MSRILVPVLLYDRVPASVPYLAVWSELGRPPTRRVTVADGDTVEANFQVGRAGS